MLTQQLVAELSNAFSQALSGPVEFYGKAVDEKGEPRSGANVRFGCVVFPEKHFTTFSIWSASMWMIYQNGDRFLRYQYAIASTSGASNRQ